LAALAATGLPAWYAHEVVAGEEARAANTRKLGPNDKIQLGVIGSGDRYYGGLAHDVKRHADFKVIAVCDVDKRHRDQAAAQAEKNYPGVECAKYGDYRELCARKDIDAVLVVTPDHWHALAAIAALKSGKDVYCEKPLSLTVAEGQAMVKAVRETNRVFQTGSQQRSDSRFRLACELVRNGQLGKVRTIETRIGENPQGGPFPEEPVPEGLDWEFWLGPTPKVNYVKRRCHYEFRWWQEYSGGKLTDWGAHHNDIAQWALGMDESGPVSVEAMGYSLPTAPNCYNHPRNFEVTYKYGNGTELICMGRGENGVLFVGERGKNKKEPWMFVDRGHIRASDEKLLKEPLSGGATRLTVSTDHMGNWRDCLRSRQRPICDVDIGYHSVVVCHLGNIALRLKRPLQWDPAKEEFIGDAEANGLLRREMRSPWKLEA
jgi:predicted dehydrogenase